MAEMHSECMDVISTCASVESENDGGGQGQCRAGRRSFFADSKTLAVHTEAKAGMAGELSVPADTSA